MITNGMLTLSSNTVFYVNNTGPALVAGNYLIVSNVTGALPPVMVSGGGATSGMTASLQIENNELDLVVAPAPAIGGIRVSGTMLTLTVTNGPARQTYILLESTNLALPVARWKPILTNSFDMNGNLSLSTNVINLNNPLEFYLLQIQ